MSEHVPGYDAYCLYLAVTTHFKSPAYDFFEYDGNVSAKVDTFKRRKDRWRFGALEKKMSSKQEMVEFLVANIMDEPEKKFWVGNLFKPGAQRIYNDYVSMKRGAVYQFRKHMSVIEDEMDDLGLPFHAAFDKVGDDTYPFLYQLYTHKQITLETMLILDLQTNFINNTQVDDDIRWPTLVKMWRKYQSFIERLYNVDGLKVYVMERLQ